MGIIAPLMPDSVASYTQDDLKRASDDKVRVMLEKLLMADACYMWAMAPDRFFCGFDFLGIGTM
eukprot:7824225-Lingulodinium_polyedra.AAC.1